MFQILTIHIAIQINNTYSYIIYMRVCTYICDTDLGTKKSYHLAFSYDLAMVFGHGVKLEKVFQGTNSHPGIEQAASSCKRFPT